MHKVAGSRERKRCSPGLVSATIDAENERGRIVIPSDPRGPRKRRSAGGGARFFAVTPRSERAGERAEDYGSMSGAPLSPFIPRTVAGVVQVCASVGWDDRGCDAPFLRSRDDEGGICASTFTDPASGPQTSNSASRTTRSRWRLPFTVRARGRRIIDSGRNVILPDAPAVHPPPSPRTLHSPLLFRSTTKRKRKPVAVRSILRRLSENSDNVVRKLIVDGEFRVTPNFFASIVKFFFFFSPITR